MWSRIWSYFLACTKLKARLQNGQQHDTIYHQVYRTFLVTNFNVGHEIMYHQVHRTVLVTIFNYGLHRVFPRLKYVPRYSGRTPWDASVLQLFGVGEVWLGLRCPWTNYEVSHLRGKLNRDKEFGISIELFHFHFFSLFNVTTLKNVVHSFTLSQCFFNLLRDCAFF